MVPGEGSSAERFPVPGAPGGPSCGEGSPRPEKVGLEAGGAPPVSHFPGWTPAGGKAISPNIREAEKPGGRVGPCLGVREVWRHLPGKRGIDEAKRKSS